MGELVKEYGKSKNISAEYVVVPANVLNDKLAAAFAAGAPPDAFMNVSAQGLYYLSRDSRRRSTTCWRTCAKCLAASTKTRCRRRVDGKVQALPIEIDISPMFVRKDLLAKVGLSIPQTLDGLPRCGQGDPEGRPNHPAVWPSGLERQ